MKYCFLRIGLLLAGLFSIKGAAAQWIEPEPEPKVIRDTIFMKGSWEVNLPKLPDSLFFAGEQIPLHKAWVREALQRELMGIIHHHTTSSFIVKRSTRYFPAIDSILRLQKIPADLKYMAVIESDLIETAISPAKAVGIWQFMPETGKLYDLEVNDQIDERYHFLKETKAACELLKDLYRKFGNWGLVAASYNAGPARVSELKEVQRASTFFDIQFPTEETSRYFFRMLAAKIFFENLELYGYKFPETEMWKPVSFKWVEVNGSVENWADWAKNYQLSYKELKLANPWLRTYKLENPKAKTYKIAIPQ